MDKHTKKFIYQFRLRMFEGFREKIVFLILLFLVKLNKRFNQM